MTAAAGAMRGTAAGGPLIVELVGLPGAGKTTLVTALLERLNAERIDAVDLGGLIAAEQRTLAGKLVRTLAAMIRHPLTAARAIAYFLRGNSRWVDNGALPFYYLRMHRALQSRRLAASLATFRYALADQLLTQCAASMATPGRRRLDGICGALARTSSPRVDLLVRLECSDALALQRMRDRRGGRNRFDGWDDAQAAANLSRMRSALDAIGGAFAVETITLDALAPVDSNAAAVARALAGIESQRGRRR